MSKLGSASLRLVFNDTEGFVVYHGGAPQVLHKVAPDHLRQSDWESIWAAFRQVEINAYHRSPEGKAHDHASSERVDELRQSEANNILARAMKSGSFPWEGELAGHMTKVRRTHRVVTALLLALQAVDISDEAMDEFIANVHIGRDQTGETVVMSWTSGSFGFQYLVVSQKPGKLFGDDAWPIYVNLRDGQTGCWQLKRVQLLNVDD